MAIKSIGIDIREASEKGAGKGRYTLDLVRALIQSAPKTHFTLYTKSPNPHFPNNEQVRQVCIPGKALFWHWNLKKHLLNESVDWFLAPTSFVYPAIAPKEQKIALLVHDLIAFLHSKSHPWFPTLVERLTLPRALKKARLILTVSENTKKDLHKLFPFSALKKTILVPPALPTDIGYVTTQKLDLPNLFILAVGTLLPRKNIALLFEVLEELSEKHPNLHLCIAGGKTEKSHEILASLPAELKDRVHFFGHVNSEQLCELYSRARVFCFPSLYEGFGIPPLEAMACGCPVVASTASSVPEVVGDSAVLADPTQAKEWAEAVDHLLDLSTAKRYQKLGIARVKEFSWEKSAKALLENL